MERILNDIKELPKDLFGNTGYKYILRFIDLFSKFAQGYLCKNKEASTILYYTKEFFKNFSFPDELGTNNGTEYIHKKFNNIFLKKILNLFKEEHIIHVRKVA